MKPYEVLNENAKQKASIATMLIFSLLVAYGFVIMGILYGGFCSRSGQVICSVINQSKI